MIRTNWHWVYVGISVFIIGIMLGACNLPAPDVATPDFLATYAAQTVAARLTQEAVAPPTTEGPIVTPATPAPSTETPLPTISPTPTSDADCDRAIFIDDVTIADGTEFKPETTFTKTWRLKNSGSCTWTTEYHLVFIDGDQMGGSDEVAFPGIVDPEREVDLSVGLTAPDAEGTYRGNWQLRNASGGIFGIGDDADEPFWVEIVVSTEVDDLELGAATWRDRFDGYLYWFLLDTDQSKFEIKNDEMVMKAFTAGGLDEWGLSSRPVVDDFYLEMTARTGSNCSGLDRYGMLIRASDPNHAYVYGFSCNGRYRLYRWNDGEYKALADWKSSGHIISGPKQTNRLGILAEGNSFKLYANGKLLTTVTDSMFDEGRFGLFIGAAETDNFEVFVEEVAYWSR
ncbi:MAG: hypothetical protein GTO14_14080 [Anaerolineales bacterium]|nr:hypothetical protein [Anaerolineales bacterium]